MARSRDSFALRFSCTEACRVRASTTAQTLTRSVARRSVGSATPLAPLALYKALCWDQTRRVRKYKQRRYKQPRIAINRYDL